MSLSWIILNSDHHSSEKIKTSRRTQVFAYSLRYQIEDAFKASGTQTPEVLKSIIADVEKKAFSNKTSTWYWNVEKTQNDQIRLKIHGSLLNRKPIIYEKLYKIPITPKKIIDITNKQTVHFQFSTLQVKVLT